jgi:hypothetical protein
MAVLGAVALSVDLLHALTVEAAQAKLSKRMCGRFFLEFRPVQPSDS